MSLLLLLTSYQSPRMIRYPLTYLGYSAPNLGTIYFGLRMILNMVSEKKKNILVYFSPSLSLAFSSPSRYQPTNQPIGQVGTYM